MTGYSVTAQFYDAIATGPADATHVRISEALAGRSLSAYPIVDIGAGTGLTTQAIALAVPDAEIFAVEPDPAMRAALMTRVCSSPDLRRRVSVVPKSIFDAPLPRTIAAAVASASLVHFSPEDRKRLWSLLARHLADDGCALIEIQCPIAQQIANTCMATTLIGRVAYEGWAQAERAGENRLRWQMTYIARVGDEEIDRQTTEFVCWTASAEDVISEASVFGLMGHADGFLVTLRPRRVALPRS